jgi:hypothetical protein
MRTRSRADAERQRCRHVPAADHTVGVVGGVVRTHERAVVLLAGVHQDCLRPGVGAEEHGAEHGRIGAGGSRHGAVRAGPVRVLAVGLVVRRVLVAPLADVADRGAHEPGGVAAGAVLGQRPGASDLRRVGVVDAGGFAERVTGGAPRAGAVGGHGVVDVRQAVGRVLAAGEAATDAARVVGLLEDTDVVGAAKGPVDEVVAVVHPVAHRAGRRVRQRALQIRGDRVVRVRHDVVGHEHAGGAPGVGEVDRGFGVGHGRRAVDDMHEGIRVVAVAFDVGGAERAAGEEVPAGQSFSAVTHLSGMS